MKIWVETHYQRSLGHGPHSLLHKQQYIQIVTPRLLVISGSFGDPQKLAPNNFNTNTDNLQHAITYRLQQSHLPTLKCGGSGVVVNKVLDSLLSKAHLPAKGEW